MKTTLVYNIIDLHTWVEKAKIGDQVIYHQSDAHGRNTELFEYARELFDLDKVILFHHHLPENHGVWQWVAQRCSNRAAAWLDRVSKLTPAPYNPHAHDLPLVDIRETDAPKVKKAKVLANLVNSGGFS